MLKEVRYLKGESNKVLKLNIDNPVPFGSDMPDEILTDAICNLPAARGYYDSKGLYSACRAIMRHYQAHGMCDVTMEDIYIDNGVSELIVQAIQALLNSGDGMLIPAPDYPLWIATVSLSGGKAAHYFCDESSDWLPDLGNTHARITPHMRGIVIINSGDPTGTVYSRELLMEIVEIVCQRNPIISADEIYNKILYDDAKHHSITPLALDLPTITSNELSRTYRIAGFRQGQMVLSGPKEHAKGHTEGLEMLVSARLCTNIPTQRATQTTLGDHQNINKFITPDGRLYEQHNHAQELVNDVPGVSYVRPCGVLHMFPEIGARRSSIHNNQKMVLGFLLQEKVLLVQETTFNWPWLDHFRIVTLLRADDIGLSLSESARFPSGYHQP